MMPVGNMIREDNIRDAAALSGIEASGAAGPVDRERGSDMRKICALCLVVLSLPAGAAEVSPTPGQTPAPAARSVHVETVLTWGERGTGDGQFHSPIGLAIDADDVLYTTEFRNNRVQRFSTEGTFLGKFPVEEMPGGIAVDREGAVYVAPMLKHKICVYDKEGKLLREWGQKGTGDGEFDQPGGIAIATDGTVYVADQVNRRIQAFTPEGQLLRKWGEYGSGPGQFDGVENKANRTGGPNFVTVDRHGHVWTTEAKLGRVQEFSPEGKPLSLFGSNSTDPGGFGGRKSLPGPIAILVDPQDRVWVTATNHRVQVFDRGGKLLGGFESLEHGEKPGEFYTPHGMAMDSKGFLYVVDAQNQRVQKVRVTSAP